jgi:chlorobactene glucosyltransferase
VRALAVVLWVVAAIWAVRIAIALLLDRRGRWSLSPEDAPPLDPAGPLVSVLIPARDEEATIGACLAAVLAQDHRRIEVVVADDQSRDATAEVARRAGGGDERVMILRAAHPEAGWMGKSAALWAAQAHARGEWLLFLDADARLHPRAVSVALAAAKKEGAAMVSWLGRLELESFWERTVLPVMADLIARWAPVWSVNLPGTRVYLANGQFILIRREVYDALGGHRAVRGEVAEDVALCRLVKERGRDPDAADPPRYRLYRAKGLMTVRMYRSLRSIWLGFAKNAYAALGASAPRVAGAVVVVVVLDVLPWVVGPAGRGRRVAAGGARGPPHGRPPDGDRAPSLPALPLHVAPPARCPRRRRDPGRFGASRHGVAGTRDVEGTPRRSDTRRRI